MKTVHALMLAAVIAQGSLALAKGKAGEVSQNYHAPEVQISSAQAKANAAKSSAKGKALQADVAAPQTIERSAPIVQDTNNANERLAQNSTNVIEDAAKNQVCSAACPALAKTVVDVVRDPSSRKVDGKALTKIKAVAMEIADKVATGIKKFGKVDLGKIINITLAKFGINPKELQEKCG
jgi:hypothetical protein